MVEVASIPTEYNGIRFRSRLEARWAAFFDAMSIPWSYEPIDLKNWIPDFEATIGGQKRLVEVKPAGSLEEIAEHVTSGRQLADAPDGTLVLGARPFGAALGIVMHVCRSLKRTALDEDRALLRAIEVAYAARGAVKRRTARVEHMAKGCGLKVVREVACEPLELDATEIAKAWPGACNATQYKGPRVAKAKPENPGDRILTKEEAAESAAMIIAMLGRDYSPTTAQAPQKPTEEPASAVTGSTRDAIDRAIRIARGTTEGSGL